ncbi:hypothetical protein M5K25_004969 [Dendrobium thyrsiflorum]|uniref:Uncharacterized protein n=1 Tax=Dendrobium thyrsiflorum TaxID=117978 RepID=A0ABD0VGN4_DENTH
MQVPINAGLLELKKKLTRKTLAGVISEGLTKNLESDNQWSWMKNLKLKPWVDILLNLNSCPRGCGSIEDTGHIVATYSYLLLVVKLLNQWGFQMPCFSSFDNCIEGLKRLSYSNPFMGNLYNIAIFLSWKSRNKLVHEGKEDGVDHCNQCNFICFGFIFSY